MRIFTVREVIGLSLDVVVHVEESLAELEPRRRYPAVLVATQDRRTPCSVFLEHLLSNADRTDVPVLRIPAATAAFCTVGDRIEIEGLSSLRSTA